ncbi:MAG: 4-hydroxybenzoate octaprenyltransferase [Hyphomicrobiales bacterium]
MSTPETTNRVADAPRRNWVDRFAPAAALPYCHLARLDRPIGTWLLLWPCWWSLALAAHWQGRGLPDLWLIVLFGIGAVAMRGCGCTYNDLVDREFDARVARTRSRPIPSGRVSVIQAKAFLVFQALVGLAVLLQFNWFAVALGAASLLVVAVYPFMKRVTYWPQFVLGLAFNWGALLGWAAVTAGLHPAPVVLYVAGIAWTLGYDTIYAHQDKEDDALIGLKSTALKFGARTTPWMTAFYTAAIIGLGLAGWLAGAGTVFFIGIAVAAAHAAWQVVTLDIDDPDRCLTLFRSNRDFGTIVFAAIVADALVLNGW